MKTEAIDLKAFILSDVSFSAMNFPLNTALAAAVNFDVFSSKYSSLIRRVLLDFQIGEDFPDKVVLLISHLICGGCRIYLV